jgi:phosphoglycerate dehydrogenase-like enzyme
MSFKILLLAPDVDPSWPEKIRRAVPGVVVKAFVDPKDAADDIVDADAAYGTVPPELLARATKLRWICAARAGLGGAWFYDGLVKSDVIVTNMRGSYNEHLAGHAVAFILAFARRFDHYLPMRVNARARSSAATTRETSSRPSGAASIPTLIRSG